MSKKNRNSLSKLLFLLCLGTTSFSPFALSNCRLKAKGTEYSVKFVEKENKTYTGNIEKDDQQNYIATINCKEGYEFFEENFVEIKCGEQTLNEKDHDYELKLDRNNNSLIIIIFKQSVTSNITIDVKTKELSSCEVKFVNIDKSEYEIVSGKDTALEKHEYQVTLKLNKVGYEFDSDNTTIACGEELLNKGSYEIKINEDKTLSIEIKKDVVNGNISIDVKTKPIVYQVKYQATNCDYGSPESTITIKQDIVVQLKFSGNSYEFDESKTIIKCGDSTLSNDCYLFDQNNNSLTIYGDKTIKAIVDHNLTNDNVINIVIGTKQKASYNINFNFDEDQGYEIINSDDNTIFEDQEYKATFKCKQGYEFTNIDISCNNKPLEEKDYELTKNDENQEFVLTIHEGVIKNDVLIAITTYKVKYNIELANEREENKTYIGTIKNDDQQNYVIAIKCVEDYEFVKEADCVEIKCGEQSLDKKNYKLDLSEDNTSLTITLKEDVIQDNIIIDVKTKEIKYIPLEYSLNQDQETYTVRSV